MIRVIGLMSGTSGDGVDAAALDTDGRARVVCGPWLTVPYDAAMRRALHTLDRHDDASVRAVEASLTDAHTTAVERLSRRLDTPPRLIGFHGQTIFHDPARGRTWQIGDAARLAAVSGVDVVADFRSADVAAGGEGAPFAPLFHAALADELEKPLAVLNIGGVANVTFLDEYPGGNREDQANAVLAFDTGPGNALLDDWVSRWTTAPFDRDGRLAAAGTVDASRLTKLLADSWFAAPPPKSLDRNHFSAAAAAALEGMSAADGAATLTAFTAASAALAGRFFPRPPKRWLVCGGGRRNPTLMQALNAQLGGIAAPVEAVGWQGDALEAQAFAYLAVRSRAGLPLSLPGTTGVAEPCLGGRFFPAARRAD